MSWFNIFRRSTVKAFQFTLYPNSCVIVETPANICAEHARQINESLSALVKVPGNKIVMVQEGFRLKVVHRETIFGKRYMTATEEEIGSWLSAALDDPQVCDEMKESIRDWFDQFAFHSPIPAPAPTQEPKGAA